MKSDLHLGGTLEDLVLAMSDEELVEFANDYALAQQNSVEMEGFGMDQPKTAETFLETFRRWRMEAAKHAA